MIATADMNVVVMTPPAVEPVSLAELKLHCRVDHTEEDTLLSSLITTARMRVEKFLGRTLITTGLAATADTWPLSCDDYFHAIIVPMPPLISVTLITYTDLSSGAATTLASSEYVVDTYSTPGRIVPAYNVVWPSTRTKPNSVIIAYTAGYGTTAASVPDPIRTAIKIDAADLYRNRETNITGTIVAELPGGVQDLLSMYRVYEV